MEYRIILPPLPTGVMAPKTVFLQCDVTDRPYLVFDFTVILEASGCLKYLHHLESFQMNHVWMVTLKSLAGTYRLLGMKEHQVIGGRCLVQGPNKAEIRLKLHWVSCQLPNSNS